MTITSELIDKLLQGCQNQDDLVGQDGLIQQLNKALIERSLQHPILHNGTSSKITPSKHGQVQGEIFHNRNAESDLQSARKDHTRFEGMEETIISLYARGMTVREIQGHLRDIHGVEVSSSSISEATDTVMEEFREWQNRPLDAIYPILYLDALMIKVKSQGRVVNKSIYWLLASTSRDTKKCWVCGLLRLKERSSGYKSSRSSRPEAYKTSSSPA